MDEKNLRLIKKNFKLDSQMDFEGAIALYQSFKNFSGLENYSLHQILHEEALLGTECSALFQ